MPNKQFVCKDKHLKYTSFWVSGDTHCDYKVSVSCVLKPIQSQGL